MTIKIWFYQAKKRSHLDKSIRESENTGKSEDDSNEKNPKAVLKNNLKHVSCEKEMVKCEGERERGTSLSLASKNPNFKMIFLAFHNDLLNSFQCNEEIPWKCYSP